MKKVKKRAPRNRTLTVSQHEAKELKSLLSEMPCGAGVDAFLDRVFVADLNVRAGDLPANSVDLLFLDPPYNLTKDYGHVKFHEKRASDYETWFEAWLKPLLPALKPTATIYICCDWRTSVSVYNVVSKYLFIRNRITWEREKGRGALENWKNCSEDIWYATVSKTDFTFNVDAVKLKRKVLAPYTKSDGTPKDWKKTDEGSFRLTHPSNMWSDISIPFWSMPENTDHPTQKPEKLLAKLILASSNPGDVILDPFLGSGTTAVVAKKLDRHFIGIEINPEFATWAQKRLLAAEIDKSIQGYCQGVFWERNSGAGRL